MPVIGDLIDNIRLGARLALFRPVERRKYRVGVGPAACLIALGVVLSVARHAVNAGEDYTFQPNGIGGAAVGYLVFFASCLLIALVQRTLHAFVALIVVVASSLLTLSAVTIATSLLRRAAFENSWVGDELFVVLSWAEFLLYLAWWCAVLYRAFRLVFEASRLRLSLLAAVFAAIAVGESFLPYEQSLWRRWDGAGAAVAAAQEAEKQARWAPYRRLNVESVFYQQGELMRRAAMELTAQRPGITDLYFITFGSHAYQDVFERETRAVQALFDARFDTAGRSLRLVNNLNTVHDTPLASVHNLKAALRAAAARMDLDEDILFLFLTSHGSRDHRLSVDFWPLQLNRLGHRELARTLDEIGFKWRVVVVSACYSGGFIDALKSPTSLIVTASRADRNSFGCSNERKFTYFGQAYFDEALRQEFSFVRAFAQASETIKDWERREHLTPSEPQIHIGAEVGGKLDALEARLRRLQAKAPPGQAG